MKRLDKILKPSGNKGLEDLIRRARDMDELTRALVAGLGPDAGRAIVAANLRKDGMLVVLASSPSWAARLRFDSDAILDAAHAAGIDACDCMVRVARGIA